MKFGLKNSILSKLCDVFAKHPEIDEIIIYGSRAKGNYRENSDIDITLKGDKLTMKLLNKISWDLDDLLLQYTIDISI